MEDVVSVDLGHTDAEEKNGRSRNWLLLLYPDNDEHKKVLEEKLDNLDWDYCGRVHDSDEGVKLHHHVIVSFKNGRLKDDVAADLDLEPRWLRRVHSVKKAMRYLCHKENPDKYQYSPEGIYGTMADKAMAQCKKGDAVSEQEGVLKVVEIINEWPGIVSVNLLLPAVCEAGVYSHYRRLGNSIFRLIEEHNRPLQQEKVVQEGIKNDLEQFHSRMDEIDKILAGMSFEEYLAWRERNGFSNAPQKPVNE